MTTTEILFLVLIAILFVVVLWVYWHSRTNRQAIRALADRKPIEAQLILYEATKRKK